MQKTENSQDNLEEGKAGGFPLPQVKTHFKAREIKTDQSWGQTQANRLTGQNRNQVTHVYGCLVESKAPLPFSGELTVTSGRDEWFVVYSDNKVLHGKATV